MSVAIDLINKDEAKQKAAFAKWRLANGYDARTIKERELHDYVEALLTEIADLKAELYHERIILK